MSVSSACWPIALSTRHTYRPSFALAEYDQVLQLLQRLNEPVFDVLAAVDQRARPTLDDGDDVVAGNGLVGLQRVGQAQHLGPVLAQQRLGIFEQAGEVGLDALAQVAPEQIALVVLLARPRAATASSADAQPAADTVRRDGLAHAPVALHHDGDGGGAIEVAHDPGGVVAPEEHALSGE